MNNKKLLIFVIILISVGVLSAALLFWFFGAGESGKNPGKNEPTSPASAVFSCVSVTFGEDPKTCVNITWHSSKESDGAVCYTKTGESEKNVVCAKREALEGDYLYRAYLTNLSAGTEYEYTLSVGETLCKPYKFKTQKDGDEFNFILVSDEQGFTEKDYSVWGYVIKTAAMRDYDFILSLGDSVEDGKNEEHWSMFFDAGEGIFENSSVVTVLGNQDKKNVLRHFTYGSENDNPSAKEYFSFNIGKVHFSILNSGDGDKDLPKAQLKWLKKDLEASENYLKIVCIHKAPYSNFNHANDSEIVAIREQLTPVCEEYGVSVVLMGHDHAFYRGTIGNVTYFMNSSAGTKQHNGKMINSDIPYIKSQTMKKPTYTYVSVGPSNITFDTYEVSSLGSESLFDSFSLPLPDNRQ